MIRLRPSEIRFVQDSINNVFDKKSNHARIHIGDTLDKLCEGRTTVDIIPRITVCQRDGKYWSADNRRLWVFREYERLGGCTYIPVILNPYWCISSQKFTTINDGESVYVRRRNPGGQWHRKPDNALRPYNAAPQVQPKPNRSINLWRSETKNNNNTQIIPPVLDNFSIRDTPAHRAPTLTRYGPQLIESSSRSDLARYFGDLNIQHVADQEYLDPMCVLYTKKTIPATFSGGDHHDGRTLSSLVQDLTIGRTNVTPITVHRVWGDDRVTDGNRRLWAYREAQKRRSNLRIPVVIKTDEEELKTKIRENNSKLTLSLKDILLFDGDDVEVIGL